MRKLMNRLLGFLPVSRRKFELLLDSLQEVLDAMTAIDAQHSNIEKTILDKLFEETDKTEKKEKDESHIEFG